MLSLLARLQGVSGDACDFTLEVCNTVEDKFPAVSTEPSNATTIETGLNDTQRHAFEYAFD